MDNSSRVGPPGDDRFRILFEHSSDALFILNHAGFTDCNGAAVQLFKARDRTEILSVHPGSLSPKFQLDGRDSLDKANEMIELARRQGFHRFEWTHRKLDGEEFPVEVTLNPVTIDGVPFTIAVVHDLTWLKRAESDLRRQKEQLEALNARLRQDLICAARIQRSYLPKILPKCELARFGWACHPTATLGGDHLNIFPLDERHIGLYLLDVSGHGVPASLLAVAASRFLSPTAALSFLRIANPGTSQARFASPHEVVENLNRQFCDEPNGQFITVFYGVLDLLKLEIHYAIAGHPRPLVVSADKRWRTLEAKGLPIGIIREARFEEAVATLEPGDRLWLFSDGLIEAMNSADRQFGIDQLTRELQNLPTASSNVRLEDLLEIIWQRLKAWTGDQGPHDDVSIVVLEINSPVR
jgi:sigma-B regulation protein RsbU (phosphoserine phosphatase)